MAGDVKTVDSDEALPTPDYQNPFPGILGELQKIAEALGAIKAADLSIFDVTTQGVIGFAGHQWQRLHVQTLVFTTDFGVASPVTLAIGSFTRTFSLVGGVNVLPYPVTIERGTDIVLGGTAGARLYIIATPE